VLGQEVGQVLPQLGEDPLEPFGMKPHGLEGTFSLVEDLKWVEQRISDAFWERLKAVHRPRPFCVSTKRAQSAQRAMRPLRSSFTRVMDSHLTPIVRKNCREVLEKMLKEAGNVLLGDDKKKGLLKRSGLITALFTTVFVIIEGYALGDVAAHVASQKSTLMPLWVASLTTLIGNPSSKG
jgi:hypothetical protein